MTPNKYLEALLGIFDAFVEKLRVWYIYLSADMFGHQKILSDMCRTDNNCPAFISLCAQTNCM